MYGCTGKDNHITNLFTWFPCPLPNLAFWSSRCGSDGDCGKVASCMQWGEGRSKVSRLARLLSSTKPSMARSLNQISLESRISGTRRKNSVVEGETEAGGSREAKVFLGTGEEGWEDWECEEARGDDQALPLQSSYTIDLKATRKVSNQ